jgi:AcrR family transcriptional regulator
MFMNNDAKKKITRKEQALQTRRKLFNAGIRLLGAVDIDEVRINDICDEVGVSVGVFYHYFSSKEDLLMEAYHFFDEEVVLRARKKHYNSNLEALYFIIGYQCGNYVGLFDEKTDPQVLEIMSNYEAGEWLLWQHVLRTQLKLGGKNVIERNRPMNIYVHELIDRALNSGELVSSLSATEISETVLRISRGVMFDWAVRGGEYKAYEDALKDVKGYLKPYLPCK